MTSTLPRSHRIRRRRIAVSAIALALAPIGLVACGTSDARPADGGAAADHGTGSHQHPSEDATAADDGVFDITASEYAFTTEHPTVASGDVSVRLTNAGAEAHQVQIGKVRAGVTPASFTATFEQQGEPAAFALAEWVGGVNGVEAHGSGTATVHLEPGDYIIACFMQSPDGQSHVMKHMVESLQVTAAEQVAPSGTVPSATEQVSMGEYRITFPDGFRGKGTVAFHNEGSEDHEVVLIRLRDGKTLADAATYQQHPDGTPPFTFAGGIGTIGPGATATAELDLQPGNYIATCFVPGPGGQPHIQMGMLTTFTVT